MNPNCSRYAYTFLEAKQHMENNYIEKTHDSSIHFVLSLIRHGLIGQANKHNNQGSKLYSPTIFIILRHEVHLLIVSIWRDNFLLIGQILFLYFVMMLTVVFIFCHNANDCLTVKYSLLRFLWRCWWRNITVLAQSCKETCLPMLTNTPRLWR